MDLDPASLGADRHGVFTRAEALDRGESDRSLLRAVQRGVLVRLRRGMYVSGERYAACDDSGKHLLHAYAAVAAQGGEVALTGASAAALHGFTIYQQDLSVVHLLRLDGGSGRRAASASHHHYRPEVDEPSSSSGPAYGP
ncbi:type IV toxin-antitoxin system AbiEi family antitoxin domain-containing protein [Microlunatus sagamiharensis]|uniref:type IV toxin-antitoxin system AbiEi family antitoxin domain-containing protein n=1 Tax=Microlunatus sagamiharensis TaxID=546874 RepID=UPI000B88FD75|nr:type IV toxin-antitoxin system AbiEi family antitoxin domain-containing protein [Microlunatus sagamiharensis]